jgi:uncharacterized membrane protein
MYSTIGKKFARCLGHCAIARVALALAVVLLIAAAAHACPTCKEGIDQNDPTHQSMAAGYYYSILFMMSMPFVVLGTFCSVAYLSIRRARERQAAGEPTNS